jgi:hypothetical protein
MMEPKAPLHTANPFSHRPIHVVLARANGPLFYGVAIASLLEATASLSAQRLLHFIRKDSGLGEWVMTSWLPGKVARAQALQAYVEKRWPEYDWARACEQYRACANAEGGLGPRHASAAQELLARCVAAAQAGLFYRALAHSADDPELREIAREMAQVEAESFQRFRKAYELGASAQRFGFALAWRTARACVRTARDTHVQLAFRAISAQCGSHVPFPVLSYDEFIMRMRRVIERHAEIGTPERILFGAWKKPPTPSRVEEPRYRVPDWFKPFFKSVS